MSYTVRASRRLSALYRDHLTPPGRALLWGLLAAGVLRMGALSPPLYAALACMAALFAVAVLSGLPFRPRVDLQRRMRDNPTAGRPWFYDVVVENRSRRTARDLVVEEIGLPAGLEAAPAHEPIPRLGAGERAVVSLGLTCARRGAYELPALHAATLFPTGLVKPSRRQEGVHRLIVHPTYDRLSSFHLPDGGREDEGDSSSQRGGQDFAGLRDWRDGDRPQDVHWPAYARTGRLAVRETADQGRPSVALMLDTGLGDDSDAGLLDAAVAKAAAVAEVLLRHGHALDLLMVGPSLHRPAAVGPDGALLDILDLLAVAEADAGLDLGLVEAEIPKLAVVILVLPRQTPAHTRLIQRLDAAGVATRVVLAEGP